MGIIISFRTLTLLQFTFLHRLEYQGWKRLITLPPIPQPPPFHLRQRKLAHGDKVSWSRTHVYLVRSGDDRWYVWTPNILSPAYSLPSLALCKLCAVVRLTGESVPQPPVDAGAFPPWLGCLSAPHFPHSPQGSRLLLCRLGDTWGVLSVPLIGHSCPDTENNKSA